jgi:hypothetical protein
MEGRTPALEMRLDAYASSSAALAYRSVSPQSRSSLASLQSHVHVHVHVYHRGERSQITI